VSICSSVDVSPEAVAVGLLVVDLVFEQEYFLRMVSGRWLMQNG